MPASVDAFITALRTGSGDPEPLLDQLEDLEAQGPAGHTPLGSATFHGRRDLAERLLKRGADVNAVYANGRSPLFGAVARGDERMMRLLVEHGADVNRGIPSIGHAPLHRSAYSNLLPFVEYLLSQGADVNVHTLAPNPDFAVAGESGGESPLHYAAGFADADVIRCLLRIGADPSATNTAGQRPADWAISRARLADIVDLCDGPRGG